MGSQKKDQKARMYNDSVTLMMVALTMVIVGVQSIGLPPWSAALTLPAGVVVYILGFRRYKASGG